MFAHFIVRRWHFLNELIREVEEYFILWDSTRRMRREALATALDHELVSKFAKEFMELYNGIYF